MTWNRNSMLAAVLALVACGSAPIAYGQASAIPKTEPILLRDSDGEATSQVFDYLTLRAIESKSTIFVISRLGHDERSSYNYRRLHNALYRLTNALFPGREPPHVVGAIGERTKSTGVVEIYLGGELLYIVNFRKNHDFTVDCCPLPDEPPPREYFPYYRGPRKYQFP